MDGWGFGVLRFLRFPKLEHFGFLVQNDNVLISHLLDFLTALPPTLETVEFHFSTGLTALQLPAVFECVPQVTRLIFVSRIPVNLLDPFITLQNSSLLPMLRVFKYVYPGSTTYKPPKVAASSFLRLMEERKESGVKRFCFELVQVEMRWAPDVRRSLRLLVEQGFELEIVEESVPVDWLGNRVGE
ncbi:hypothetical protein P691DRAFT_151650 [Macrolepiota fuliginosa MF-IS2]|uniref:Uncharacterized protein n=1 Tax=Macrolepiota fuliginosa MF-IS2 TaxID=1400762 RepID=A0A9P5XCY9_9AGAR|nr:hypothetical protein P691DRAFT_151650 [Macrolepiota fuliginosa MF-IS2]